MPKYSGEIYVEIEAKDDDELEKILDAIVNAKLPKKVDEKILRMKYDMKDFMEW